MTRDRSQARRGLRWCVALAAAGIVHLLVLAGLEWPQDPRPTPEREGMRPIALVPVQAPAPPQTIAPSAPPAPAVADSAPSEPTKPMRRPPPQRAVSKPFPQERVAASEESPPRPPGPGTTLHLPDAPTGSEAPTAEVPRTDPEPLRRYLEKITHSIADQRRYPPQARRRHQEGRVRVQVIIGTDGGLRHAPQVLEGSTHRLLDEEALRMVAAAAPFPPAPGHAAAAAGLTLAVPVDFRLRP